METQRFLRLRELFDQAMQLPPDQRAAFAASSCGNDAQFHQELIELLDAQRQAGSYIPAPPPGRPNQVPERIGAYKILSRLGQGGMGVVYLALRDDGAFTKKVALKLIREGLQDQELLERFRSERQVLAALEHPNIARILDGGDTQGGAPYYVMEFVEGEPLDEYCRNLNLGLESRIRLFQQLCTAVAYLHWKQILHRDLKPGNILVTPEGTVKLLDFGIAKVLSVGAPDLTGAQPSPLTPAYASPEQLAGRTIGPPADVYALGVILYQLISGSLPDPITIHPPSLLIPDDAETRRKVSGDLDSVTLKALERDPARRYQTPAALAEDLQHFLDQRPVTAHPVGAPVRAFRFLGRHKLGFAGAVLLLALLAAGSYFTYRSLTDSKVLGEKDAQIQKLLDALNRPTASTTDPQAVDGILSDVKKLRESLQSNLMRNDDTSPQQTELRKAVLDRSTRYLESLKPVVEKSAAVAREVGYTYIAIGDAHESGKRPEQANKPAAVASFTAAAQALAQAAAYDPQDPGVHARLEDLERRLGALEAQMPAAAIAVLHPVNDNPPPVESPAPVATKQSPVDTKQVVTRPPPEPPPPAPVAQPPAAAGESAATMRARQELQDRFITASARVQSTDQGFEKLKSDLAAKGLSPRPQVVADVMRMKILLQQSQADISRGDLTSAGEAIGIVEALTARVEKEIGR